MKKKLPCRNLHKNFGRKGEQPNPKKERLILRGYVSLIMIMLCLLASKINAPQTKDFSQKLKTAISQSITVEEARKLGELGMEKVLAFKNEGININK